MKQVVLAALILIGACVPYSATTGAKNNGEQLAFQTSRKRYKVTERKVTGETDHYGSDGSYAGTSQQVKLVNRTKLGPREVRFFQGDDRVGEADFYRIGGDIDSAKLAQERQRRLFWMNAGGWGASVASAAGITAASLGAGGKTGVTTLYISASVVGAIGTWLLLKTLPARKDARVNLRRAAEVGVRF